MTVQSPAVRTPERSDSATSSSNLHIGALIFGGASTILVALRLLSEVISAISCDVAMLEMGEDEGGAGDVADFAGACGDVLEGAPAADEQGEPAFAETAQ